MMDLHLTGKAVLVTGAGSGIGRSTALAFAGEGCRVAVCDIDARTAAETVASIRAQGGTAIAVTVDIADAASVAAMAVAVVQAFGGLDIAINNAGIGPSGHGVVDLPEEAFDRMLAINLKGVWLCMRQEIPRLQARGGGVIINTASVMGVVAAPGGSAYVAAKHGVVGLTKAAAAEFSSHNIRINAICPGIIVTPLTAPILADEGRRAGGIARHPIGRLGEPREIADAMLWLASDRASFATGEVITIDGGWSAV